METALITGASSGIGRAFAHLFAKDGYRLVLVGRRAWALEALRSELRAAFQTEVTAQAVDLAAPGGAELLHAAVVREQLQVDVLVNNAGVGMQGPFVELPLDRQLQMMTLNMTSLTTLTRLLVPGMVQRKRGGVLNVGSTAGFQPGPFMAVYYATKAYVVSFSEALYEELSGTGVVVTCLAPGPTETSFAKEAGATATRLFRGQTMTADEVARIGYEAWKRGESLVIAGARNRFGQMFVKFAPRAYVRRIVGGLNISG